MNKNAIPNKLISISDFKIPNLSIRRFFILINGNRTLGELMNLCHIDEIECKKMIKKLLEDKSIEIEGFNFDDSDSIYDETIKDAQVIECKGFHDCLTKELALYIGPVARIIVDKTDAVKTILPISKMNQIVEEVAQEIDDPNDRLVFIETMTDRISTNKGA